MIERRPDSALNVYTRILFANLEDAERELGPTDLVALLEVVESRVKWVRARGWGRAA